MSRIMDKIRWSTQIVLALILSLTAPANSQPNPEAKSAPVANETSQPEEASQPPVSSLFSPAVEQAVHQFRANPNDVSFSQILEALKSLLAQPAAMHASAGAIIKDNPGLQEFKPRVIEAAGIHIWTFPKSPQKNQVLVQWLDTKHTTVVLPRNKKKIVTTASVKLQSLLLPDYVNVREAGFVANREGHRLLILAGEGEDSSLWVNSYALTNSLWTESPGYINSLPSLLVKNVSGHVTFRNPDMIFNIGKMVQSTDSSGVVRNLPEAESSTYKFWLRLTDNGYVIVPNLPDEESFKIVQQFMQAIQQGRSDIAKSLLSDNRIVSLFKYMNLLGKPLDPSTRIVQMSMPASKGQRFRLINMGKDELIFDVTKAKGIPVIKAIFVAPPDPFLQEASKYFPLYAKQITPQPSPEEKVDTVGQTLPLPEKNLRSLK